jgi:hypothetical protein
MGVLAQLAAAAAGVALACWLLARGRRRTRGARGPQSLVAVVLEAYWTSLADDPLAALLFTALASLAGVLLVLLGQVVVQLLGELVAAVL